MVDDYEDILSEQEEEQFAEALADEHQAELEVQLERDEEPPQINEPPETKRQKRELEREALSRIENAARTADDFKNVIVWWNRLDSNRERRERYHEIRRSGLDIPLDYGAALDGEVIPYDVNDVLIKQIRKGDYIDVIFHCPFELKELVTDGDLSKILYKLSDDHKEIIFNTIVRNMSKKILLIRDSFACVVAPFLALQTSELHICDMRNYEYYVGEKLNAEEYIKQIKPDYVIVLYSGVSSIEKSNGKYDFF